MPALSIAGWDPSSTWSRFQCPPKIPYGRFSRVRLQGWLSDGASYNAAWLSLHPTYPQHAQFASILRAPVVPTTSVLSREAGLGNTPPCKQLNCFTPEALAPVRVMLSRSIHA